MLKTEAIWKVCCEQGGSGPVHQDLQQNRAAPQLEVSLSCRQVQLERSGSKGFVHSDGGTVTSTPTLSEPAVDTKPWALRAGIGLVGEG